MLRLTQQGRKHLCSDYARGLNCIPEERKCLRRFNPGEAVAGFGGGEDANFAAEEKPQRFHRLPNPADVGDNRDPLPIRDAIDTDLQIVELMNKAA